MRRGAVRTIMPDENAALLAAICDNPEDDAVRLVYATGETRLCAKIDKLDRNHQARGRGNQQAIQHAERADRAGESLLRPDPFPSAPEAASLVRG
jgi:hypothetical protein